MRWSMCVATVRRPAAASRRASTTRSSPSTVAGTPLAASSATVAASRSLSFTRSSPRPRMRRRAPGEGGRDRQDRVFVDHRGRARRPAPPRRAAPSTTAVRSPTGSPPSTRAFVTARSAPISRSVAKSPVRSGLSPTPRTVTPRARHQQRGDQREGGGGRVAGHRHGRGPQLRLAVQLDRPGRVPARPRHAHRGAEMAQHVLGVVAGRPPAPPPA